jgi:hypothetical protein
MYVWDHVFVRHMIILGVLDHVWIKCDMSCKDIFTLQAVSQIYNILLVVINVIKTTTGKHKVKNPQKNRNTICWNICNIEKNKTVRYYERLEREYLIELTALA